MSQPNDYKLEFTAEATQVASRKLASLDRECRLVLTTDQTNVLELAAFAPDQRFKVTVELAD